MLLMVFEELDRWKWKNFNDFNILLLHASIIMFLVKDEFITLNKNLITELKKKAGKLVEMLKVAFFNASHIITN